MVFYIFFLLQKKLSQFCEINDDYSSGHSSPLSLSDNVFFFLSLVSRGNIQVKWGWNSSRRNEFLRWFTSQKHSLNFSLKLTVTLLQILFLILAEISQEAFEEPLRTQNLFSFCISKEFWKIIATCWHKNYGTCTFFFSCVR